MFERRNREGLGEAAISKSKTKGVRASLLAHKCHHFRAAASRSSAAALVKAVPSVKSRPSCVAVSSMLATANRRSVSAVKEACKAGHPSSTSAATRLLTKSACSRSKHSHSRWP
eukprot:6212776-Pleurochrysis_carterae.AAC.3